MSARLPDDWSDLDDPLSDPPPSKPGPPESFLEAAAAFGRAAAGQSIQCRACGGSGVFRSRYTGRDLGQCFACQGTGKTTARRERAREAYRKGERTRQANEAARRTAFAKQHGPLLTYLQSRVGKWEFATSLWQQFQERGSLSDNQLAAIQRALDRDAQRLQAQLTTTHRTPDAKATGIDLSNLPAGRYAVPGGDTRLKLLVSRPKPPSRWAGFTFVSDAAQYGQRKQYGRQPPGGLYAGDVQEALRAILADPEGACAAYGRLTGTCGICGAHLEDADSVARGIGPVCAGKFGG